VKSIIVIIKANFKSKISVDIRLSLFGTLSFNAKYVANREANRTVSPPRKNQNPKNLFFPSRVALSGDSGHVLGVNCSSTCIMPLPPYPFYQLAPILVYGSHDH